MAQRCRQQLQAAAAQLISDGGCRLCSLLPFHLLLLLLLLQYASQLLELAALCGVAVRPVCQVAVPAF